MCSILRIGDPSHPSGIKNGIAPRLNIERESFFVDAGCTGSQTPVPPLVKVDEPEEDDNFWRGDEWTLEVNTGGGRIPRICKQVAGMLAVLKLQIGRSQIQRVDNATVESGIMPGIDMADSRCLSDVIDGRLNANVSIRGYIELLNPVREARRGYEWTLEADLNEGVVLGLVQNANGIKFANGRHCSLQGKVLKRLWKTSSILERLKYIYLPKHAPLSIAQRDHHRWFDVAIKVLLCICCGICCDS